MDAKTLATEVAPIIIQLPPKAVWTATAAVAVAVLAVIANIWVNNRTLKHQKESEENKRQHDTLLKNQEILLSKFEEFFSQLRDLEIHLQNLSDQLVGRQDSSEESNRGFPRYKKLDSLNALAKIYFSEKINQNLMVFTSNYGVFVFGQFPKIYSKFNDILIDKRQLSKGNSSQLKYYHQYKVQEIVDMVYDYFYEEHKGKLSLEEIIKISPPWITAHDRLLIPFYQILNSAHEELEQLPIKKQYKLGYRVTHPDEQ